MNDPRIDGDGDGRDGDGDGDGDDIDVDLGYDTEGLSDPPHLWSGRDISSRVVEYVKLHARLSTCTSQESIANTFDVAAVRLILSINSCKVTADGPVKLTRMLYRAMTDGRIQSPQRILSDILTKHKVNTTNSSRKRRRSVDIVADVPDVAADDIHGGDDVLGGNENDIVGSEYGGDNGDVYTPVADTAAMRCRLKYDYDTDDYTIRGTGYTVTNHAKWNYDEPAVAPRRVIHIKPMTLGEANAANPSHAAETRKLTVELSAKTRRLLRNSIFGKTGEYDRNVLRLCRTGLMNKCSLYAHSEWADSVALCSDSDILSGEPIGCIMGRLREKSSLADSSSLATLTAVHIPSRQLPASYYRGGGADLFIDTSAECNELAYIRDPRNSFLHQTGGANCYSDDTRLMTEYGFLFLNEVLSRTDNGRDLTKLRFACYNPETQQIEYHPASALIVKPRRNHHMVEFTSVSAQSRWSDETADEFGRAIVSDDIESNQRSSKIRHGGNVSLLVTADHDMYVQRGRCVRPSNNNIRWEPIAETDEQRNPRIQRPASASASASASRCPMATVKPHTKYSAISMLQGVDGFDAYHLLGSAARGVHNPQRSELPFTAALSLRNSVQLDAFLELYGFWIGHGSLNYSGTTGIAMAVTFSRRKKSDLRWLRTQSIKCGLIEGNDFYITEFRNPLETHHITVKSWVDFFDGEYRTHYQTLSRYVPRSAPFPVDDELTIAHPRPPFKPLRLTKPAKLFAEWVMNALTFEQTRLVLEGFKRADGSFKMDAKACCTSSVLVRDQLMTLYIHAGYSPHYELKYAKGEIRGCQSKKEHSARQKLSASQKKKSAPPKIRGASFYKSLSDAERSAYTVVKATADTWAVSYRSDSDLILRHSHGEVKSIVGYVGRVWCVTVPTGLVVAQRAFTDSRGIVAQISRPIIAGNCQSRIVWNGEDGLVYLTVVALCDIPAQSELLMVDTNFDQIAQTRLELSAKRSHWLHRYAAELQRTLVDAEIMMRRQKQDENSSTERCSSTASLSAPVHMISVPESSAFTRSSCRRIDFPEVRLPKSVIAKLQNVCRRAVARGVQIADDDLRPYLNNVRQAAVYEVVSLDHPVRFFTPPNFPAFSLIAVEDIPAGTPLCIYLGRYLCKDEFELMEDAIQVEFYSYAINAAQMNMHDRSNDLIIESHYAGNNSRFINDAHFRRANTANGMNVESEVLFDEQTQLPVTLLKASKNIAVGDELISNYVMDADADHGNGTENEGESNSEKLPTRLSLQTRKGPDNKKRKRPIAAKINYWDGVRVQLRRLHDEYAISTNKLIVRLIDQIKLNGLSLPKPPPPPHSDRHYIFDANAVDYDMTFQDEYAVQHDTTH